MPLDPATRPQLPDGDLKRSEHQALRARMLCGGWADDLEHALGKHIRSERRSAWGIGEMSRNPFRALASQVGGALYRSSPETRAPAGSESMLDLVERAGLWQLQQRGATDLVGMREGFLRVDHTARGGLLYRPVPVELLHLESVYEAPDSPALVEELQERIGPNGKPTWCWEVLDIRDLAAPVHQILSPDRTEDWTSHYMGGPKLGDAYQFRGADGVPVIPGVLYHAERTGRLWDSFYGVEAVLGSLTVAVLLTFWVHGVKDGSFATVVIVGGKISGLSIEGGTAGKTQVISTEPGSFIEVAPSDEGVQPQVIQLQPGFDPEKLMTAIGMFEQGLAEYAGVSAADLVRTGADPRSGASLSISREGLRSAQARFEPQLRRGDLELLSTTAKVLNRATGSRFAESGYTIGYPALPLSSDEVKSLREDLLAKTAAGLMSKVDAYMRLHPGVTRDQAVVELQRIQRENAMFASTPLPTPTL